MSEFFFTAGELAKEKLPGLPGHISNILLLAKREAWPFQKRQAAGGGKEYPITALPKAAREALLSRSAGTVSPASSQPPAVVGLDADRTAISTSLKFSSGLADWQRRCMDARAAILMEVERLAGIAGQEAAISAAISAVTGEESHDLIAPAGNPSSAFGHIARLGPIAWVV